MTATEIEMAITGFKFLSKLGDKAQDLIDNMRLMPNVKFPTMGGEVIWNDLVEESGWRIQRNSITSHCRIIDPKNKRHAWGSEEKINEFFRKLADIPK